MKGTVLKVVGGFLAAVAVLLVAGVAFKSLALTSIVKNPHLISITGDIGKALARYFWNYRPLDILGQAIALLLASAGVVALLRREEEEEGH